MNSTDSWKLLRAGKADTALNYFKDSHTKEPTPSRIMELGVAYLFVQRYEAAWSHFSAAIKSYLRSMSSFYGMAGTSKWCLGEFDQAVGTWRDGLRAHYADTAGLGIQMPLLLLMASTLKPAIFDETAAKKILKTKAEDSRIRTWRGPLASWILGDISDSELRDNCSGDNEPDTQNRHWIVEFYFGIRQKARDDQAEFLETMRRLTDISRQEWSNERFFLSRMWSEEFFIARHEAQS